MPSPSPSLTRTECKLMCPHLPPGRSCRQSWVRGERAVAKIARGLNSPGTIKNQKMRVGSHVQATWTQRKTKTSAMQAAAFGLLYANVVVPCIALSLSVPCPTSASLHAFIRARQRRTPRASWLSLLCACGDEVGWHGRGSYLGGAEVGGGIRP